MGHTYTNLLTHIIFSTKDRLPYLLEERRHDVFAYMGGIVRDLKGSFGSESFAPKGARFGPKTVNPRPLAVATVLRRSAAQNRSAATRLTSGFAHAPWC
jgi:hypothetical protein